jgi:hypothetical protein
MPPPPPADARSPRRRLSLRAKPASARSSGPRPPLVPSTSAPEKRRLCATHTSCARPPPPPPPPPGLCSRDRPPIPRRPTKPTSFVASQSIRRSSAFCPATLTTRTPPAIRHRRQCSSSQLLPLVLAMTFIATTTSTSTTAIISAVTRAGTRTVLLMACLRAFRLAESPQQRVRRLLLQWWLTRTRIPKRRHCRRHPLRQHLILTNFWACERMNPNYPGNGSFESNR